MFILEWPVKLPVTISQRFGMNTTGIPTFYTRWGLQGHEGIDFAGSHGDPIYAAHDATIISLNVPGKNGIRLDHAYGIHIKLRHIDFNGQKYETDYCHLSAIDPSLFKRPDFLPVGTLIGYMGNTGNVIKNAHSDGTHLHFMLRKVGASARRELQTLPDGRKVVFPNDIINPISYLI